MVYGPKFLFVHMPGQKVIKHDSSEKQGCVLCFKGHFEWYKAILADKLDLNM